MSKTVTTTTTTTTDTRATAPVAVATHTALPVLLHKHGVVQRGEFTLRSGARSDTYVDLRRLPCHPALFERFAGELSLHVTADVDAIIGVPWGAVPLATRVAGLCEKPLWMLRKEAKAYGAGGLLARPEAAIGSRARRPQVALIEDVTTTGGAINEAIDALQTEGVDVVQVLVGVCRDNRVLARLKQRLQPPEATPDRRVVALLDLECLRASSEPQAWALSERQNTLRRAGASGGGLIVSVDVPTTTELLAMLELVGSSADAVKIHADLIGDFSARTVAGLQAAKRRFGLTLIEDRKLSDIGSIMRQQLTSGPTRIAEWADHVIAHGLSGRESLRALCQQASEVGIGTILVVQMSSSGNLLDERYQKQLVGFCREHPDALSAVVAQERLEGLPDALPVLTPGIRLAAGADAHGQRYRTPTDALRAGSDYIIVGRGITQSDEPAKAAGAYRAAVRGDSARGAK